MRITKTSIQSKIALLKDYQQDFLNEILNNLLLVNSINVNDSLQVKECSHCGSEHIIKHGGNRLRCKACGKTQTTTKDTVLYRIQNKEKWVDFVFLMLSESKPLSLNDIRKRVPMTLKTAHAWRHRFLTSLVKIYDKLNPLKDFYASELEIDEIYLKFRVKGRLGKEKYHNYSTRTPTQFRESEKQKCDESYQSIFACVSDRYGRFEFLPITVQKKGVVSTNQLKQTLDTINLKGKTIITDKGTSICSYMKSLNGITHKSFVSADIKKGLVKDGVHNNNINNVMSLFRQWQKDFKGYSTKYEWNYLTWFKLMRMFKSDKISLKNVINDSVRSLSHSQYKGIFGHYKQFAI